VDEMRARKAAVAVTAVAALSTCLLAGAPVVTAGAGVGGGHAAQAATDELVLVAGDFTGDAREEVFVYRPGTAPDHLATFTDQDASAGHPIHAIETSFTVNGRYRPVAANVDADPYDEILWYAPGTAADYRWDFRTNTAVGSTPLTVNGYYTPLAGDFTADGTDDVFWYGPGTAPDFLWDVDASGTHSSTAQTVNGTYLTAVGSFGTDATDDVFFYNVDAAGPDHVWDFVAGTTAHRDTPYAVSGTYRPYALDLRGEGAGGGDIFWYGPGAAPDYRWDFSGARLASSTPDPVNGYYDPVVTADLFADGSDDILWVAAPGAGGARTVQLWDHDLQGSALARSRYQLSGESWPSMNGVPGTATATAFTGAGSGEVELGWDAVAGATGYRVLRGAQSGFVTVASIDVTTGATTAAPEVTGLWSAEHTYDPYSGALDAPDRSPWFRYVDVGGPGQRCYRVIARNTAGDGPASTTACGSPP
jgi:hypothetical protein